MDVKTNAQRLLIILLTILLLFSIGSFIRDIGFRKIGIFVTDPSALISFNKYLYINLRPEGEILVEDGKYSSPFADKKEIVNSVSGFDYFIFSRTYTQRIANGADFRRLDIQQTGSNTISVTYSLNLRREPTIGSQYHIQVDLPKINNVIEDGDSIRVVDECQLVIIKEFDQRYDLLDGYILDISKIARKEFNIQIDLELNCNQ